MTHRRGPARGPLSPGPPAPEEEKLRRLIGQLPDSTHRRFKQLAAEQGVTVRTVPGLGGRGAGTAFWVGAVKATPVKIPGYINA